MTTHENYQITQSQMTLARNQGEGQSEVWMTADSKVFIRSMSRDRSKKSFYVELSPVNLNYMDIQWHKNEFTLREYTIIQQIENK